MSDSFQKRNSLDQSETKKALLNIFDKFGSTSTISKILIEALVQKILVPSSTKTLQAFNLWNNYLDLEKNTSKIQSEFSERRLKFYSKDPSCTINKALFAIDTYVSIIMKLIGLNIVMDGKFPVDGKHTYNPVTKLTFQENDMKEVFFHLENGDFFSQNGIDNFVDGTEIFSWYLNEWDKDFGKLLYNCFIEIVSNKVTLFTREDRPFDVFGKFYLDLIPAMIRKILGEVYTPQWLADFIVTTESPNWDLKTRILDPSCGSGIFLMQIIERLYILLNKTLSISRLSAIIQENIIGFDINPLAILIARTNLLYILSSTWSTNIHFIIPIFLTNSLYITLLNKEEEYIEKYDEPAQFFRTIVSSNKDSHFSKQMMALYELFSYRPRDTIDKKNKTKMTYLNILAPFSQKKFDTLVGNPPWVNWEYLSEIQKNEYLKIYSDLGLQTNSYWKAKLGTGKYDFSAIFIYIVVKNYLKIYGNLFFIIPTALLKGNASAGFRKFKYSSSKNNTLINSITPIKLLEIHDLSSFQPFPNANAKTMILHLKHGLKTEYPVDYIEWHKCGNITTFCSWNDIKSAFILTTVRCAPIVEEDSSSCLLTAETDEELVYLRKKIFRKGIYHAYEGSNTEGFNAAFWIKNLTDVRNNNELITFDNYNTRQKQVVLLSEKYFIEKKLIYPLLRANNIKKWYFSLDTYIVYLPKYDEEIITNEKKFEKTYPFTYQYLYQLKRELESRTSYKKKSNKYPFYIFYGKKEMKCPIKVCWTRMSILSAVVVTEIDHPLLGKIPVIPQETVVFVPVEDLLEAHYLCAILNSAIFGKYINLFKVTGTKSFASPEIFDKITIPAYDKNQTLHYELALLSVEAHNLTIRNQDIHCIQTKINNLTDTLFNTTSPS